LSDVLSAKPAAFLKKAVYILEKTGTNSSARLAD